MWNVQSNYQGSKPSVSYNEMETLAVSNPKSWKRKVLINSDWKREFLKLLSRTPQGYYPLMLENVKSNPNVATNINSRKGIETNALNR